MKKQLNLSSFCQISDIMRVHQAIDRKYKDALFICIFGNEQHKEFTLTLYNAMNYSEYTNVDDLEIVTPGKVLFIRMKNDVAYLFQSEMFLYEQQSIWSPIPEVYHSMKS